MISFFVGLVTGGILGAMAVIAIMPPGEISDAPCEGCPYWQDGGP